MRPFSLTTRLTTFFALSSATVLLGLGALIASSMDQHFAYEDFAVLQEKASLVRKIAREAEAASMPVRLGAALQNHPGLVAWIQTGRGASVYATDGFEFRHALSAAQALPAGKEAFTWKQDGAEYRGCAPPRPPRASREANCASSSGWRPGSMRTSCGASSIRWCCTWRCPRS